MNEMQHMQIAGVPKEVAQFFDIVASLEGTNRSAKIVAVLQEYMQTHTAELQGIINSWNKPAVNPEKGRSRVR